MQDAATVAARTKQFKDSLHWMVFLVPLLNSVSLCAAASLSHLPPVSLQQLLKMRDDLKQRELELEKSLEEKLQLKSQVQNLKEGLQKLQNSHAMQVSSALVCCCCAAGLFQSSLAEHSPSVCGAAFRVRKFICATLFVGEEDYLICTLITKKWGPACERYWGNKSSINKRTKCYWCNM